MPKRGKKKKAKRQLKQTPQTRGSLRQTQFIGIHNSDIAKKVRDTKIAESIKVRMKEDNTLTEIQMADLRKRRAELIKN